MIWSCAFQQLDRPSLQAFLTLTDLHPHALTFCQPAQPAALKRRRMDENILPAAILSNEAKPLVGVVHFNRTDAFLVAPTLGCRCEDERGAERPAGLLVT
jgi:hypothetical protein